MNTIDDKYLGDRVKALEEGGIKWLVPKPPAEASITDDFFISDYRGISIYDKYKIINNRTIYFTKTSEDNQQIYLYFKKSAFNLNSIDDFVDKFSIIGLQYYNTGSYSKLYPSSASFSENSNYYILLLYVLTGSDSDYHALSKSFKILMIQ